MFDKEYGMDTEQDRPADELREEENATAAQGSGPAGDSPRAPGPGPRPERNGEGWYGHGPMGPGGERYGHGPMGPGGGRYGHGPMGPGGERYGRGPMGPGGERFGHGPMGPGGGQSGCGPMGRPPRRQPAFRPGFVPEEERREHYESLSLGDRITFQIKSLSHMLNRMPESRDGQRRVLEILMDRGSLSQRELMELCQIRSGSLSELIARMEMSGYIARVPNPRDRRTLDVSLTEAGLLAAQTLRTRRQDLYEGISRQDQETLLHALEALSAHFREKTGPQKVPILEKTEV